MRLQAGVLGAACLGAVLSCAGSGSPESGQRTARALASEAVHTAFESGAFEVMREQALVSSFAVAKARVEGTGKGLTTEQSRQLEAVLRKVLAELFPREAWEEALLPLYLDALDRKELEKVVQFQRSALGGKLMAIHSRVITGGGVLGDRLLKSRQAELTKRLAEELDRAWSVPP